MKKNLIMLMMLTTMLVGGCGKASNTENTQTSDESNMESIIETDEVYQEVNNIDKEEQEPEKTSEIEAEVKEEPVIEAPVEEEPEVQEVPAVSESDENDSDEPKKKVGFFGRLFGKK